MKKKATLTFCGGALSPTGSNFLLETEERSILVDCGLFQGEKLNEEKNNEAFLYDPTKISTLFVTHAHMDHIGRIPKLVREGFQGEIWSTPPTRDMTELMLLDSVRVLARQAEERGFQPPYEEDDVRTIMRLWKTKEYHEVLELDESTKVQFLDSGHILGSAMIEIDYNGSKVLFTGDLGNTPAPLLHETEIPEDVACLIMESVYGDRNHEDKSVRQDLVKQAILETVKKGGTLLIPVFSIERTQDMLFVFNELSESGQIPHVPVFLDSPLAIKVTEVYKRYQNYFNDNAKDIIASGDDIFRFPMLRFTQDGAASAAIAEVEGPKIVMAGSGMMNGGRIVKHAKQYLSDPKNTLLLVGYQAVGTLGRKLQDGEKRVLIEKEQLTVRAKVMTIQGYSAHKQSDDLIDFVARMSDKDALRKVFVVLGEPKSALFLSQRIRDYVGIDTSVPKDGESVELLF